MVDNHSGAGWCWIAANHFWERIAFFYGKKRVRPCLTVAFLFLDMFVLTILYSSLFHFIRKRSKVFSGSTISERKLTNERRAWFAIGHSPPPDVRAESRSTVHGQYISSPQRRLHNVSFTLLCYPVIYFVLVLPLTISRLMEFANRSWSLIAVYVGATLFACQGWVNVLLYTATRQGIISWHEIFRKQKLQDKRDSANSGFDPHFPNSQSTKPEFIDDVESVMSNRCALSITSLKGEYEVRESRPRE